MAEPTVCETNIALGLERVVHPVLKSNMRPAAALVVESTTPQIARPEITPPPETPPQAAKPKMQSLPYIEAMSQSVRLLFVLFVEKEREERREVGEGEGRMKRERKRTGKESKRRDGKVSTHPAA